MTKTLILIPVMYSREELKKILDSIPDDFEATSREFWHYVEARLKPLDGKVSAVYLDKPTTAREGNRAGILLKSLKERCKSFHIVDDPLLAAEADGWRKYMVNGENTAVLELLEETIKERDKYAIDVIVETLEDGKIGVLFIDPSRKITFPDGLRVIRMCPFDPMDYLNRHIVRRKIDQRQEELDK